MTREKELRMLRKYREVLSLGERLLRKHNLSDWKFYVLVCDRPLPKYGVVLGQCVENYKHIFVYVGPLDTPAEVRQTVLHEIAHALVGSSAGHGGIWQRKAREIGVSARQVADYRERERKY